jgi:hypothetical protein
MAARWQLENAVKISGSIAKLMQKMPRFIDKNI